MKLMRQALLWVSPLLYLLACAFVAAALAYPLHFALPESVSYQTLVFKSAQVMMILGLLPLGYYLGMGRADVGLAGPAGLWLRQMARAFAYGAIMLGVHVTVLLLMSIRVPYWDHLQWGRVVSLSWKGVLIGLGIATLEEPLFRGFLHGFLRRSAGRCNTVVVTAVFFAALHFLSTDLRPEYREVRWDTGFMLVADAFKNLAHIHIDSFLALFVAGAFLGSVRLLSPANGLSYCMGLHAGWVFIIRASNPLTLPNLFSPLIYWVSSFDGNIGYFSASWTALLTALLAHKLRSQPVGTPCGKP